MDNNKQSQFMERAIELAQDSVKNGGGPFGAVIVKDGKIVAEGSNCVTLDNDPTAHAEVTTIRKACQILNTFELNNCEIYTSCEPCPMCLAAIYWSRIDKIFYGCNKDDAKNIGFDDSFIYEQIELKPQYRSIPSIQILQKEALSAFKMWEDKADKVEY